MATSISYQAIHSDIQKGANAAKAKTLMGFFKTGQGQYGEGDRFLGLTAPQVRSLAKKYHTLSLTDIQMCLKSPFNDERLTGLLILVNQFENGDKQAQEKIYKFYLKNLSSVNNWNLVDSSAHKIIGPWLYQRKRKPILDLANSKKLWEKRISILACYYFIQQGETTFPLKIIKKHLADDHDLIHKACGWMLRELGKRHEPALVNFLKQQYSKMPRTCLRYAIERFPMTKRKKYLLGKF